MKAFLQAKFGNELIKELDLEVLKEAIQGDAVIGRLKFRKNITKGSQKHAISSKKKKTVIKKGEVLRKEANLAKHLEEGKKNPDFGFFCLNHTVSESSGSIKIKILNKKKVNASIGFRTVELPDGAKGGKDFGHIPNKEIVFKGNESCEVEITIVDDDQWEPDKEFACELYDLASGKVLPMKDTRTTVLILDDDKPGFLSFKSKVNVKHIASEEDCVLTVQRTKGSDGSISCKWRTVNLENPHRNAVAGVDYVEAEGELKFEHNQGEHEITIKIIQKEGKEEKRDEIFGVQIYEAKPSAVRISKKDTCVIEIVTDAESKK